MFFMYVLASAWAMSAVVGRSFDLTPKQMTYEKEDKTTMKSHETSQVMAIGDRSSNLKYVRAIQGSMIWEEIKKQSLKVKGLDGKVTEKSPDKLTDGELAQLKQACHDGLKCLAVDQLLKLTQFKEPLTGGKVSVRKAITKITQVLTQYTTEYHEDVYQYEAVKQSDDQTKVYETVTTIVEDNKELCQVDLKPTTRQSRPKNVYHNTIPEVVNNNSTVNYNTTKNYNINNGTINSATINKEPSDIITVVESPKPGTQANKESDPSLVIVIAPQPEIGDSDGYTKKRSVDDHLPSKRTATTGTDTNGLNGDTKAPKNDVSHKRARQNHARGSGTSDQHYEPGTTDDHHPHKYARSANEKLAPVGEQLTINDGPSPHEGVGTDSDVQPQKARWPRPDTTSRTRHGSVDVDKKNVSSRHRSANTKANTHDPGHSDHVENNNVNLKNGGENGQPGKCHCDHDIVSAGSWNQETVRKGLVDDGTLNNGNMVQYNINNGTINKGTISGSNADKGIISVGVVNNGPVNYGTSEAYANNGNQIAMDSHDVQQYLLNIEKMYSTILERLR